MSSSSTDSGRMPGTTPSSFGILAQISSATMLTVVDLDGLNPEAINELMQGTRQAFYRGEVYHAVSKRSIATLKGDPDLDQLEKEAEQNLLEMKAADAAVKSKLDQLIEGHHVAAENNGPGTVIQPRRTQQMARNSLVPSTSRPCGDQGRRTCRSRRYAAGVSDQAEHGRGANVS